MKKDYLNSIVKHYENCLEKYGDTHLGVDWPKAGDAEKRYEVMLDVIRFSRNKSENASLLDFGCGAAHLLEYMQKRQIKNIEYAGLDVSEKFVDLSKVKHADVSFYCMDILNGYGILPDFDYVIMNGVFTEKRELSFNDMWEYFCRMLLKIFPVANKGIAFNVMSKAVDWERNDLFHVPTDLLIDFLTKNLSRDFILRNDYGLYEYTAYVYK